MHKKMKNSTYTILPRPLIWHFSTDQSKLKFENLVISDVACLQLVYLYITQPCLHTVMQALSANKSTHTILAILQKNIMTLMFSA